MKNGKMQLSEEDVEKIQEELTAERDRQEKLRKDYKRAEREQSNGALLARIKSLEERVTAGEELMQIQHSNIDRLLKLLENMKMRSLK